MAYNVNTKDISNSIAGVTKDRETYSFSVSYNNAPDIAMNRYISQKLAGGIRISTYVRMLIEKDMAENGIVLNDDSENGFVIKNNDNELDSKLEKIYSLLINSGSFAKDTYEKLVNLEFVIRSLNANPMASTSRAESNNDSTILNRLDMLYNLISNMSNSNSNSANNIDLSEIIDLVTASNASISNKVSDLERTFEDVIGNIDSIKTNSMLKNLNNKIEEQTETINSLMDIVNSQTKLIKELTLNPINSKSDKSIIELEDDIDSEEQQQAKMKSKKMKKAEF